MASLGELFMSWMPGVQFLLIIATLTVASITLYQVDNKDDSSVAKGTEWSTSHDAGILKTYKLAGKVGQFDVQGLWTYCPTGTSLKTGVTATAADASLIKHVKATYADLESYLQDVGSVSFTSDATPANILTVDGLFKTESCEAPGVAGFRRNRYR